MLKKSLLLSKPLARATQDHLYYYSVRGKHNIHVKLNKALKMLQENIKKKNSANSNSQTTTLTPASISFTVVGAGGFGTPKSIYIRTNEFNYLIGCPENIRRATQMLGVKNIKPSHVFITENTWPNIGGLINLAIGMNLPNSSSISLYGPSNLDEIFLSSRYFGISAGIKVVHDLMDNSFKDCCFTVEKIPIQPLSNKFKKRKSNSQSEVFNFHFKVNDRTGALDLKKCIELKVPVGPLLKRLKDGEDIELEDGRIIRQSDVCFPSAKGSEVLVIDCPSPEYLDALTGNEKLNNLIEEKNPLLKYVFHFSDIKVVLEKRYQDWINRFAPEVQHIALNQYCSNLTFISIHEQLYYFNKFDSDLFRPPYLMEEAKELPFKSRLKLAKSLDNFEIGVKKSSFDEVLAFDTKKLDEQIENVEGLKEKLKAYKEKVKDIKNNVPYPEVVFLGTSSAGPSKYRNSSGIFISLNENETCILDCGEGTLYAILLHFGPEKYMKKLCDLKFIYSTHLHSDHHIGLINILQERKKAFAQLNKPFEPVKLILANAVHDFLKLYDQSLEPLSHLYVFESLPFKAKSSYTKEQANSMGLEDITIVRVPHCYQSTGISITVKKEDGENFHIVYSGDTIPCEALIDVGIDCDLLIHEATFSDHYEEEALRKRHSTTNQAIEMRNKMNAKFLVLTHFSQRFSKLPIKSDKFDDRTAIAFDFLRLTPSLLVKSVYFKEILEVFYKDEVEFNESSITKRAIKSELLKKYIKEQAAL